MRRARTVQAKDERRQALLEAALTEFYERGFAAARMDDIAKRANLSKGALYLYFESKDALFKALVEAFAVPNLERLQTVAMSAPSALGAIRAVAGLVPSIIRETYIPRLMKVLISDAKVFPDTVRAYRKDVLDRFIGVLSGILTRAKAAGEIEIGDPALTARLVVAPVAFSAMWHVTFGDDKDARVDLEALFALHADMLEKAFTPSAGKAA